MLAEALLILLTTGLSIFTNIINISTTGESAHLFVVAILLILIAVVVFFLKKVIDKKNQSKYDEEDTSKDE